MKKFDFYINHYLKLELSNLLGNTDNIERANIILFEVSGIRDFFSEEAELKELKIELNQNLVALQDDDRAEYGDFQTNSVLAHKVCVLLKAKSIQPELIIEPTFGKGNFILAALNTFDTIRRIIGIEIYESYFWQTKFSILEYFLINPTRVKPEIRLFLQSVFDFNFNNINLVREQVLVLGNPPWVTSSMLSVLNSENIPVKSNFKNHSGFDALTGKGNFDIGEYISLMLIRAFHKSPGSIAFLVKNTVIKNILFDQHQANFQISNLEKHTIDSAKEFGAAVEAALFFAKFNGEAEQTCREFDIYNQVETNQFGWKNSKFVASIPKYDNSSFIDGNCQFEWRQGIKHDCSRVMEMERSNGHFINGYQEQADLEPGLVYGLLKSSDLKSELLFDSRKFTIVTQQKIGQETKHIETEFPKTWQYLTAHKTEFENRKSSIYNGKPAFSIFGVGEYSFQPYKVAISGMYKTSRFSLVLPRNGKPLMLDDTCYFLGFINYSDALFTFAVLNADLVQNFLQSIVFWDSKRVITKDVLMRIDLARATNLFTYESLVQQLQKYESIDTEPATYSAWQQFNSLLLPKNKEQLTLF